MKLIIILSALFLLSEAYPINFEKLELAKCQKTVENDNFELEMSSELNENLTKLNDELNYKIENLTSSLDISREKEKELNEGKSKLKIDRKKAQTDRDLYKSLHQEKVKELSVCTSTSSTLSEQLKISKLIIFTHNFSTEICLHDRVFSNPSQAFSTLQQNPFIFTLLVAPSCFLILFMTRGLLRKLCSSCTKCCKKGSNLSNTCKGLSVKCCKIKNKDEPEIEPTDQEHVEMTSYAPTAGQTFGQLPYTNPFKPLPEVPKNEYDDVDEIVPY